MERKDARTISRSRSRLVRRTVVSTAWIICLCVPAIAQQPIPEPDAIFTGRVGGLFPGARVELWWNGARLDQGALDGDRYLLRAPLVDMGPVKDKERVPPGTTTVDKRPELIANGVRQGSVLVGGRGAIFETSFFVARTSDPNPAATAVPLGQAEITPVPPTPGPSRTATRTSAITPSSTSTPSGTATPTVTGSIPATATPSETPTPTPTPTEGASTCIGDCNDDGEVAINELITGVNMALGVAPPTSCPSFDVNGDGEVGINELIQAVTNALSGCS